MLVDTKDGALATRASALRVRDDGGDAFITFKGPVEPGPFKMRPEIETAAGSADDLLAILAALGFLPVFRYEKYREEFVVPGVVVAIDETPIGVFLEVEGDALAIDETARRLGFSTRDYLTASYRSLWVAAGGDRATSDMTFSTAPS